MTPERWTQIEELFHHACECDSKDRDALLDEACRTDPELRREVEALLSSEENARDHLHAAVREQLETVGFPLIGETISHYRIIDGLAGGGMGLVYRAEDIKLGRRVALKFLPEDSVKDSAARGRFEREARAASALEHLNICPIYEFGEHEGRSFLVMQLLEGQTLRELISAAGQGKPPLELGRLLDLAVQITDGLDAAHSRGIIHRDIKPANLFVTTQGQAKILDFGLAKLASLVRAPGDSHVLYHGDDDEDVQRATEKIAPTATPDGFLSLTGVAMGTAGYMSPEQVRGEKLDARTDLFSFGLVLYEMATGQRAFKGDTGPALQNAILNQTSTPVGRLNPEVPAKLEQIIMKALEKDREARYQAASDLRADLEILKRGLERKFSVGWQTMAGGVAAVLLITSSVFWFTRHQPSSSQTLTRGMRSSNVAHAKVTHEQFTFTGDAYEPAISPDGLFVAYVSKKPGEKQKLIVQASNGTRVELAQGTSVDSPRWSPDGSQVLFYRYDPAEYKLEPTAKNWGISVISRLGGVAHPISESMYGCWLAPDGSQIATASVSSASGFKGFRVVKMLSGEAKDVHLSEYTWLYDIDCSLRSGLILAVTKTADKYQIRTFKEDGSDERKLPEESEEIYSARWSPKGDYIYYLHGKGSTTQLSKLSVFHGDSEPVLLADGLQTGRSFTLSADGSQLAYTRGDDNSNLWRVDLPIAEKRVKPEISRLTSGTSHSGEPSFSPDGHWIAFALGPNPDETNIFKSPVGGGEPVQLTFFEHAMAASPAWSPDGQRIAFIGDQGGSPRVWMISANGGAAQSLENTNASGTNNILVWWPSSDIVYQQSGVRNYLRVNEKTHEEKPVIQHDQSKGWVPAKPRFSPDGKTIAAFWNRPPDNIGLWIISLEPYSETLLQSGHIFPVGWSPDGKYVYAVREESGSKREIIRVQITAPNEIISVTTMPGDISGADGASVSPDGKKIFVSVREGKSDVWLMEHFDPSPR